MYISTLIATRGGGGTHGKTHLNNEYLSFLREEMDCHFTLKVGLVTSKTNNVFKTTYNATRLTVVTQQSFLQIIRHSGSANLLDSHTSLQSSHSCKLNTVAWVVELTYLHVVVKCESLLGGHGRARCTVMHRRYYLSFSERAKGVAVLTEKSKKGCHSAPLKPLLPSSAISCPG